MRRTRVASRVAAPAVESEDGSPLNTSPLAGYAIVHFGNDWRAENRTSSHHVAEAMSKHLPVLYVSTPGLRAPSAMKRDFGRIFDKLREAPRLPERVGEQLWTMTMPQLPFRGIPGVGRFNQIAGRLLLKRAIRHVGFKKLISVFFVPHPGRFARTLGEDLSVYYCIDAYAHLPGTDQAVVEQFDRELMEKSDLVLLCAKKMFEERLAIRKDLVYSPHGVDAKLFNTAMDPALPVAEPLRGMKRPVIGYYGSISPWLDIELMAQAAKARPEWQFVMVGMVSTDISALRELPNVHLPGIAPYKELPAWAKGFDVCVAPYLQNQQVLNSNPLKLREYLATGRPVVSIWLPEAEVFGNVIRLVKQREQFVEAIEAALAEGIEANQAARLAAVRDSTWEARGESFLQTLEEALSKKRARTS